MMPALFTTTSKPSCASRKATARPMPPETPVTRATPFDGKLVMFFSFVKLLILFSFVRLNPHGLGGCPVCGPVSVAEHLFSRMRCELDHDRLARYTQQLDADVDDGST